MKTWKSKAQIRFERYNRDHAEKQPVSALTWIALAVSIFSLLSSLNLLRLVAPHV